ncbi:MAG: helicase C-terminal domain-containing protein [Treponemataceae bacterium]
MSENSIKEYNLENVGELLSQGGPLSKIFSGFEEREGQKELSKKIAKCFYDSEIGVFEAETGVGKSLAYLLPSIIWSLQNDCRVILSTATINLQQQLTEKDAPLAIKVLGLPESFLEKIVLVKGRRNFLCLRRFRQYSEQGELFENDSLTIEKLKREVARNDFSGSKEDLDFSVSAGTWANICSEADNCLSRRCRHFEFCYVMKMKKKAEDSKILIANHHLLFNDLLAKLQSNNFTMPAVLPAFFYVVLDEAHAIEEAARSGFSETTNKFQLKKQLNALYRAGSRGNKLSSKVSGFLNDVVAISSRADLFTETVQLIFETSLSFDNLESFALSLIPEKTTWSILQSNEKEIKSFLLQVDKFCKLIFALNKNLNIIFDNVPLMADEDSVYESEDDLLVHEAKVVLNRLNEVQVFFEQLENYSSLEDYIFWFEKKWTSAGEYIQFYKTPIDLEKFMHSALFSPMESVVCTSATLKVSDSFHFAFKNLGLKNFQKKEIQLGAFPSPFPYDKNVLLNIPVDAPLPNEKIFDEFVCESVLHLVKAGKGRALVLFTSYSLLNQVKDFVKANLNDERINIFSQGELERSKLLSIFKEDLSSCLFATESFWTGVDIPGEALSHLILVKLPFEVPTHPIVFAKSRFIEKNGGKPFFDLSLPSAIIKFKQGFGRLMRSKKDKGVVSVLDSRILKKTYGGAFLKSIPNVQKNFKPIKNIIESTKSFLT